MYGDSLTQFFTDVNPPPAPKEKHIFKKAAHLIGKNYKVFPAFVCSPATWKLLDPYELKILSGLSLLTLDHKKIFITYNLSALADYCQMSRDKTHRVIKKLLSLNYVTFANYKGRKVIMLNIGRLFNHLSKYGFEAINEVRFD